MKSSNLFLTCLTACLLCIDATNGLSIHSLTSPILTALLLSWPTSVLPNRIRPLIQFLLGECVIAVCLVDCYCQEFLGSPITPQLLSNVLLSDARETHEFLSSFIGFNVILRWRIASLLLLALLLPVSFFVKCKLQPVLRIKKLRYAWLTVLLLCTAYEIPAIYKFAKLFMQKQNMESMEGLIFRHYHEQAPTPLHRLIFAYYASEQSEHVLEEIKQSTFNAGIDHCEYTSPHIVLVIGESYNKHHSSLYGYRLPTTPLQQRRMDAGELFLFTEAVTPWNITSNVFLDMFSLWEQGSRQHISKYPLFPILFQRAGYEVTFFSNQYLLKGFRKGATNQAGHFFLADVELSDSLFSYRNRKSSRYDMGLVGQLEQYTKNTERPAHTLDIVHLVGQHFEYTVRYPHSQSTFSTSNYKERVLDKDACQIVMHYDNATRYNDTVIDNLLSLYEEEDAIVLYVADHGEEVYDELSTHGRLFQEPTGPQAKNEFEVPLWIWCSRSYQDRHPDIISAIQSSTAKTFLTDGIPQILLYLAGIKCEWRDDSRNVLSPRYQPKPRIIGGSAVYDKLTK